jgi:hypothetical protein
VVAWEQENGPIPNGMVGCHRCDNPPCCNPKHIFPGTRGDNCRDREAKGRGRAARGEGTGFAKLTEEKVRIIRARYDAGETATNLGKEFEVSMNTAWTVAKRLAWKHVP